MTGARVLTASYILDASSIGPGVAKADSALAGLDDSTAKLSQDVDGHTQAMGNAFGTLGGNLGGKVKGGVDSAEGDLSRLDDDGAKLSADFDAHTSRIGSAFKSLGSSLSNFGIPFASSLTTMGDKMSETQSKAGGFVNTMSSVGRVATAAVAAGVLAFGAASVKLAVDYQSSVNQMAATGDMSIAQANKIGSAFLNMGGQTEFSGAEMVKAFGPVAGQLGLLQGHALSAAQAVQVESAAADLATASHGSLTSTTSDLASVMQAYSLKASDASNASNVLWNASRLTGTSLDSVANMVQKLHSQMGALTPPLGQVGTLLVDLTAHGETGRQAISAVNSAMTSLLKPVTAQQTAISNLNVVTKQLPPSLQELAKQYEAGTVSTKDLTTATQAMTPAQAVLWSQFTSASTKVQASKTALDELGVSVTNAKGQMLPLGTIIAELKPKLDGMTQAQQMATLSQVFGAGASRKLLDVVLAGPAAWDKEQAAVTKANSAHEASEKASQSLSVQLKTMGAAVEDEGTKFGNFLLPKLVDVGKGLADVTGFFMHNKAAAIALGVAIGGPLLAAVTVFAVQSVGKMIGGLTQLGSKVLNLGNTFKSSAGMVEDSEVANDQLNSTLGELNQTLSTLPERLSAVSSSFSELSDVEASQAETTASIQASNDALAASYAAVEEAQTGLVAGFTELEGAEVGFAETSEVTGEAASMAFGPVGIAIMALVAVGTLVATHWKAISHDIVKAWDDVFSFGKKIFGALEDFFKRWGQDLLMVFMPVVGIPLFLATHWHQVLTDAQHIWGDVVNFFRSIPSKILSVFADAGSWLVDIGKKIVGGLITGFEYLTPEGLIIKFHKQILSGLSDAGTWLLHAGEDVISGLWKGIQAAWSILGTIGRSVGSAIVGAFKDAGSWLLSIGKDILHGLFIGFEYLSPAGLIYKFHSEIIDALKDAGTWLLDIGKDIVHGLVKGIEDMAGLPGKAIHAVAHGVIGIAKSIFSVFSPSQVFSEIGSNLVQGLAKGITDSKELANAAMKDVDVFTQLEADLAKFETEMTSVSAVAGKAAMSMLSFDAGLELSVTAVTNGTQAVSELGDAANRLPADLGAVTKGLDLLTTSSTGQTEQLTRTNSTYTLVSNGLEAYDRVILQGANDLNTYYDALTRQVSELQTVGDATSDAESRVKSLAEAFTEVDDSLGSVDQMVSGFASHLSSEISSLGSNLEIDMHNVGVDMANGLIGGLSASQGAIESTISNIGSGMVNTMKSATGSHSPSTLMALVGQDLMAGISQGVKSGTSTAVSSLEQAATALANVPFKSAGVGLPGGLPTAAPGVPGVGVSAAPGGPIQLTVQVTVQGQVMTERNLVDAIWHGLVEKGVVNGSTGQLVGL